MLVNNKFLIFLKLVFYILGVEGYFDYMYAVNFTYSTDEILENKTSPTLIQCGFQCSTSGVCAALKFDEEKSTCVILRSATMTMTSSPNKIQFVKQVRGSLGLSSYIMTNTTHTASECHTVCAELGGHLATVQSIGESDFINDLRNGAFICIGGISDDEGYTWIWVNDEPWGYTDWAIGEPNAIGFNYTLCVGYYDTYDGWVDFDCNTPMKCMCETDLKIG